MFKSGLLFVVALACASAIPGVFSAPLSDQTSLSSHHESSSYQESLNTDTAPRVPCKESRTWVLPLWLDELQASFILNIKAENRKITVNDVPVYPEVYRSEQPILASRESITENDLLDKQHPWRRFTWQAWPWQQFEKQLHPWQLCPGQRSPQDECPPGSTFTENSVPALSIADTPATQLDYVVRALESDSQYKKGEQILELQIHFSTPNGGGLEANPVRVQAARTPAGMLSIMVVEFWH